MNNRARSWSLAHTSWSTLYNISIDIHMRNINTTCCNFITCFSWSHFSGTTRAPTETGFTVWGWFQVDLDFTSTFTKRIYVPESPSSHTFSWYSAFALTHFFNCPGSYWGCQHERFYLDTCLAGVLSSLGTDESHLDPCLGSGEDAPVSLCHNAKRSVHMAACTFRQCKGGKVFEMMHQKCFIILYSDSMTCWNHTVGDNTIDITSHSECHFDRNGFLANFLQTWTAWIMSFVLLLFQFRLGSHGDTIFPLVTDYFVEYFE
jgi:hypothetical protein